MRRVVITGMGLVTPLGVGVETVWSRLLASRSGLRRLPDEIVGDLPAKVGGVVPRLDESELGGPDLDLTLHSAAQLTRSRGFTLFAATRLSPRSSARLGSIPRWIFGILVLRAANSDLLSREDATVAPTSFNSTSAVMCRHS